MEHINMLFRASEIVKVKCYIGTQLTDEKNIENLGPYFSTASYYESITDELSINEIKDILKDMRFTQKRELVIPKQRIYHMFVFIMKDGSNFTLIGSSGYGMSWEQFRLCDLVVVSENTYTVKRITILTRQKDDEIDLSIFLPRFGEADFFKKLIINKEANKDVPVDGPSTPK